MSDPAGDRPTEDPRTVIERAISILGGKWTGADTARTHCPGHDDRNPSLDWAISDDGRPLFVDRAGCAQTAVLEALKDRGVLGAVNGASPRPSTIGRQALAGAVPVASNAGTAPVPAFEATGREGMTQVWEVSGPSGKVLQRVRRPNPDRPGKKIVLWIPKPTDHGLVPGDFIYHPAPAGPGPLAPGSDPVFITEGEVDADALAARGYVALGTCTGASKAPKAETLAWAGLAGRTVVLWPDRARDGVEHMRKVAAALAELSPAPVVWAVDPARLELRNVKGAGAADWLPGDDPMGALRAATVPLEELPEPPAAAVPAEAPPAPAAPEPAAEPEAPPAPLVRIDMADQLADEKVVYLWNRRIEAGADGLIAGDGDAGKGMIGVALCAAFSTGGALPDEPEADRMLRQPIKCGWVRGPGEDTRGALKARLVAAGADLARVALADAEMTMGSLQFAISELAGMGCEFIVVDSLAVFAAADEVEESSQTAVRRWLRGLRAAAGSATVAYIGHWNKNADASPRNRLSGSAQFRNACRWQLTVADRTITVDKLNNGEPAEALAFSIVTAENGTGAVAWEGPAGPFNTGGGGGLLQKAVDAADPETPRMKTEIIRLMTGVERPNKKQSADAGRALTAAIKAGRIVKGPEVRAGNNRSFPGWLRAPQADKPTQADNKPTSACSEQADKPTSVYVQRLSGVGCSEATPGTVEPTDAVSASGFDPSAAFETPSPEEAKVQTDPPITDKTLIQADPSTLTADQHARVEALWEKALADAEAGNVRSIPVDPAAIIATGKLNGRELSPKQRRELTRTHVRLPFVPLKLES